METQPDEPVIPADSLCLPHLEAEVCLHKQLPPEGGSPHLPLLQQQVQGAATSLCVGHRPHVEWHDGQVGLRTVHREHLEGGREGGRERKREREEREKERERERERGREGEREMRVYEEGGEATSSAVCYLMVMAPSWVKSSPHILKRLYYYKINI